MNFLRSLALLFLINFFTVFRKVEGGFILPQYTLKNGAILTIRPAAPEDAEKILIYMNQVGGESDYLTFGKDECKLTVEQERKFIESIQKLPTSVMLLGLIDETIISIASINTPSKPRLAHNADLAISVCKDYWDFGVGTFVIQELINFAKSTKTISVVSLSVMSENQRAIHLYEKFGFSQYGLFEKWMKVNDHYMDAVLMNLYI